ncbi:MAG: hydroxyacid dehydrogenase [Bacteroidales bacterium]|nr:hydroxyacid dehydrogenase [Bacteroidales bacterium]
MKITCVEPLGISKEHFEELKKHYASMGHSFDYYMDRREDEETLAERMKDADIAVISNIKLSENVLKQCSKLKYLSVAFTGLDHIDLKYCSNHDIRVQNAAGYSTTAVSELAVGMMLDLLRNIVTLNEAIRQGGSRGTFLGRELRGKTVGIVGTGAIGTATARLLLAFGARVIAWSRTERPEVKAMGVEYMPLDNLLSQSDIVSLHVPLCNETRGLIGERELALMKPTALLVNTARGPVADIAAVGKALVESRIAGAAFDVFEQEPPLPIDHLLLSTRRCLVTPHVAFATEESFAARADIVFAHVDEYLKNML